jgi:SAM-dependent methyltransferase
LSIEVECAAIEKSNWPVASCDVVYHCDLLSHFPDPVLSLKRMVRLLRPNGVLFFEVGIVGDLQPVWYRRLPEDTIPGHRWFFSEAALHRLLLRAGLRIERMKTFSLGPQVLLYQGLSAVYRTARQLVHISPSTKSAQQVKVNSEIVKPEGKFRAEFNNFMRFSFGALPPKFGPLTAFVIARPTKVNEIGNQTSSGYYRTQQT